MAQWDWDWEDIPEDPAALEDIPDELIDNTRHSKRWVAATVHELATPGRPLTAELEAKFRALAEMANEEGVRIFLHAANFFSLLTAARFESPQFQQLYFDVAAKVFLVPRGHQMIEQPTQQSI